MSKQTSQPAPTVDNRYYTYIGNSLEIEIEKVKEHGKVSWKRLVKEKMKKAIKEEIEKEIEDTKRYRSNINDEIIPGTPKKYMWLHKSRAVAFFRARADLLYPTPRNPYNPISIWKCRFCNEPDQSSKHYVVECKELVRMLQYNRERVWNVIRTLEGDEEEIKRTGTIIMKVYQKIYIISLSSTNTIK